MGVKDLWKLLEPTGRPVKLDTLQGAILGIDVSIWLNQAVKGIRDCHGNPVENAHLILLFNRICKLLYHRIKPVFVFDGATPLLKQQTLTRRQRRRDKASHRSARAADSQVSKFLMAKILEQVSGKKSQVSMATTASSSHRLEEGEDMFRLPPLPEEGRERLKEESVSDEEEDVGLLLGLGISSAHTRLQGSVGALDLESNEFGSLPREVQHELLLQRQEEEKYTRHDPASLPQVPDDFSNYQLSRLVHRSRTSKKLEDVRSALRSEEAAVVSLGEESQLQEVESNRIVSSDSAHYILVKGTDLESMSSSSQTDDELSDGRHDSNNQSSNSDNHHGKHSSYHGDSDLEPNREDGDIVRSKRDDIGTSKLVTVEARSWKDLGVEDARERRQLLAEDYLLLSSDSDEEGEQVDIEEQLLILRDIQSSSGKGKEKKKNGVAAKVSSPGAPDEEGSDSDMDEEQMMVAARLPVESSETVIALPGDLLLDTPGSAGGRSVETSQSPSVTIGGGFVGPRPSLHGAVDVDEWKDRLVDVAEEPQRNLQELARASGCEDSREKKSDAHLQLEEHGPRIALEERDRQAGIQEHSAINKEVEEERRCVLEEEEERSHILEEERSHILEEEEKRQVLEERRRVLEEERRCVLEEERRRVLEEERRCVLEEEERRHVLEEEERERGVLEFVALVEEGGAEGAQEQLQADVARLERERARHTRAATVVSNTMYKDAQELLGLFGIPYLISPEEAEAQCAALELESHTQGSITDDNDVLLFGGRTVYRHFFSQTKDLEVYRAQDIESSLILSRDRLVLLAYLLGSDYTEGLEGVGVVAGMEILRDFPGSQLEPLQKLKKWHEEVNFKPPLPKNETRFQKKLRESYLKEDFPNPAVREAYLRPVVDSSEETFEWGSPDLDMLRNFAGSRMGWSSQKVDDLLLPVLKRLHVPSETTGQQKITRFCSRPLPRPFLERAAPGKGIKSRRIRNAVTRIKDQDLSSGSDSSPLLQSSCNSSSQARSRKRLASSRRSPAKRSSGSGSRGQKMMKNNRQHVGKRQKVEDGSAGKEKERDASCSELQGLSASSSSSEEDFDRLVKNTFVND